MCDIGTFKSMFNSFFDPNKKHEIYYLGEFAFFLMITIILVHIFAFNNLGRALPFVEERLLSVKFPPEIKRSTRLLTDRHHYKANEFRTILYYLSYSIFKGILDDRFYYNLLKYIVIIRLLSQEVVLIDDIKLAQKLVEEFVEEYEELYGDRYMTSNIHGHLHLPRQVYQFGPLNKISAYIFENKFKTTRSTFHGSRNFEGQIAYGIHHTSRLRTAIKNLRTSSVIELILFYIDKYLLSKVAPKANFLIRPDEIHLNSLQDFEIPLITKNITENSYVYATKIFQSHRAIIQSKEYHTVKHDDSFNTIDCHTVEFRLNNILNYGLIVNFISITTENFCVVNLLRQKAINRINSTKICPLLVNRFFIEVEATTIYLLISFKFITRRCIISAYGESLVNEKNIVLSPCMDLSEHD